MNLNNLNLNKLNNSSGSGLGDSNYSITTDGSNNISNVSDVDNIDGGNGNDVKIEEKKDKSLHRFYKPPHFIRNVYAQRWITLIIGIIAIITSGTIYGFSIISNEIRDSLGYSQTDIGLVVSLGDIGVYIGVTVGFFFDIFGPFWSNLLATACYLLGYMGIWGILNGTILNSVYLMAFFLFIVGQGSNAAFTACLVPNVHNYTIQNRGKISGVLVGMFALSSGIFSLIYKGSFGKTKDVKGFLLFLTILLSVTSLVAAYFVRLIKIDGVVEPELEIDKIKREKEEEESRNQLQETIKSDYYKIKISTGSNDGDDEENVLGFNIDESSTTEDDKNKGGEGDTKNGDNDGEIKSKSKIKIKNSILLNNYNNHNNDKITDQSSYLLPFKIQELETSSTDNLNPNYLDGKRDISGLALFKSIEFWLLWIIYFFGAGGSLMYLNNIGVMAQALKKPDSIQSNLVIIFAVGNLIGRAGMGYLSDIIAKRFSRFWCVVMSSSIVVFTHFIVTFKLEPMFYPATVLTGIGYGGIVSIMISLTSLRFGPRRFGLNFGCLAFSSAAAALVFSTFSSKIYDQLSEKSDEGTCYGNHCFQLSFIISFVTNLVCVFIGLFLIFYNKRQLTKRMNNK